jgi:hypothetical protein
VNQFIEECRREWKQLRVPDPVADEMAADLAADLEEADSEGASTEDVLGSAASDPRSFAESWAAERGVIPQRSIARRPSWRWLTHSAIAALTILAATGAGLVIFASPHKSSPDLPRTFVRPATVWVQASSRMVAAPAPSAVWISASNATNRSGVEIHRVGSILLVVGLVGMTLSMVFLFWSFRAASDHWSPRSTYS